MSLVARASGRAWETGRHGRQESLPHLPLSHSSAAGLAMGYLIGTDEAGYGPNFGPLVVSATVWHVHGSPRGLDLYHRLAPAVTRDGNGDVAGGAVWIADSKVVYRAGQGLGALERG